MKEFAMIKKAVIEEASKNTADTAFYIENGYLPTWEEDSRTDLDRGLRAHSTDTRWNQYKAGTITREKAVELATKRATKEIDKETAAKLAKLDRVANAPDLEEFFLLVIWRRFRAGEYTGDYNPHVSLETYPGPVHFKGSWRGYGYDKNDLAALKFSAAVADALNQCDSILKALYQLKEKGLRAGKADASDTACNQKICGDGSGYGAIPYFEAGYEDFCFWHILKACGYKTTSDYSRPHIEYFVCQK